MSDGSSYSLAVVSDARRDLLERVGRVVGYVPVGTVDLLNVLAHPDVISLTRSFLNEIDKATGAAP